jgi:hypothetical protein
VNTNVLEFPSETQQLYDKVLQTANFFLHNCKRFPVAILRLEDPTYAEIAAIMKKVGAIIAVVADGFDPMMGQKAVEYCDLMAQMGVAIEQDDRLALGKLVAELDRKPFI